MRTDWKEWKENSSRITSQIGWGPCEYLDFPSKHSKNENLRRRNLRTWFGVQVIEPCVFSLMATFSREWSWEIERVVHATFQNYSRHLSPFAVSLRIFKWNFQSSSYCAVNILVIYSELSRTSGSTPPIWSSIYGEKIGSCSETKI